MSALVQDPLLTMRPMSEADLDGVMQLETRCYDFPWTRGIFEDSLRVGYFCWVYSLDDEVIGYGVMSVAVGEAHILNLCIGKDHQGHGLGRRLLRRLLTLAKEHRADTAFLEVRISNRTALHLYNNEGFNELGRRRGYYPSKEGREDAIVLALSLL